MIDPAKSRPAIGAAAPLLAVILLCVSACSAVRDTGGADNPRPAERLLLSGGPLEAPLPTAFYRPPAHPAGPGSRFEGTLTLQPGRAPAGMEILTDSFAVGADESMGINRLPPVSITLVSDGSDLVPLQRGPQRSAHPYWEFIPEPGKVWASAAGSGWSHAALPFGLKEKNQNCVHNGLLTFLYRADGTVSDAAWQVASETCLYLKVNLWGMAGADYEPGAVSAAENLLAAHRKEASNRIPVKPIAELARDFPAMDPLALQPPSIAHYTVYGLVMRGVHYRSDCPTRYGPYPFCDVLGLPSYSLAKSLVGALGYLLVSNRWPEFESMAVSELVPECDLPDGRWRDVTPGQLLNMTTGNYASAERHADENADDMQAFFMAEAHADKLRFSCRAWPRQSTPGRLRVYHTTDTYLLGVAMNNFIRQKLGENADFHRDLLHPLVFAPLELGASMDWIQRTYDESGQPFTGYGMVFHADDVVRLARALASERVVNRHLAGPGLERAMFRTLDISTDNADQQGLAYSHGFWGVDSSAWTGCQHQKWIPYMSGYGGIAIAMLPGGAIYYYFTDSGSHGFKNAAVETDKVLNFCEAP